MNQKRFDELMVESKGLLGQEPKEWEIFLKISEAFLKSRNIVTPVVVEIGTMFNAQKVFYRELLGAEHIGIDPAGNAEIVGKSQDPAVVEKLQTMLHGRDIDLLFIDGDHSYAAVKKDCEIYYPMTRHIVALHDISHPYSPAIPEETMRMWAEIIAYPSTDVHIAVQRYNFATTGMSAGRQMGIGICLKGA